MPRFFVGTEAVHPQGETGEVILSGEEFFHITRVLRYQCGDQLICCDEQGRDYWCTIREIGADSLTAVIDQASENESEPGLKVCLFQAIPKGDKMEQVIQKAVELGVSRIQPVLTKRCISRPKDGAKKVERWNKIAKAAAKQCGRGLIPRVEEILDLPAACERMSQSDLAVVFYENEEKTSFPALLPRLRQSTSFSFLVGPEGGLETGEIELLTGAGITSVSLGKRILRTETVAGCILAISMFATDNL